MPDGTERIVLLPRYTTFVGPGPFYTKPRNVRAYSNGYVTAWRSVGRGGSLAVTFVVERSSDLATWAVSSTLTPGASAEVTTHDEDTREWLRLKVTLSGTGDLSASTWAVGDFVLRDA